MKQGVICFFLLFCISSAYSQADISESIIQISETRVFSKLKNSLKEIDIAPENKFDNYDMGYEYCRFHKQINLKGKKGYLDVIRKNDSIFSMKIAIDNLGRGYWTSISLDTVLNWTDSTFVDDYIIKHNALFKTKYNRANYGKTECGEFAFNCGMHGSPKRGMVKICLLANKKENYQLANLASSLDPQDRAHGSLGLYFLQKNGFDLTDNEKWLIELNAKSTISVECCRGDTFYGPVPMNKLLGEEWMGIHYKWYSTHGWNKLLAE